MELPTGRRGHVAGRNIGTYSQCSKLGSPWVESLPPPTHQVTLGNLLSHTFAICGDSNTNAPRNALQQECGKDDSKIIYIRSALGTESTMQTLSVQHEYNQGGGGSLGVLNSPPRMC